MTAKIFSKDLRLAAHPMMYVFALFGVMLIIPNYPYTVVFFYGLLGIFFTFLNGRENKDVYYCAVLPVTKRDQVRARAWLVVAVELAELVIAIPFAFLSARINPNGTNLAGIDANVALFGCVLLIYGVFNVVFLPVFYKTAIRAGRAFLLAVIPMTVLMVLVEALSHFPVSMIRSSGDLISVTGVLISCATCVKNAILACMRSFSFFSFCRRRIPQTTPTIISTIRMK
mgnify:CR=1 FL=1